MKKYMAMALALLMAAALLTGCDRGMVSDDPHGRITAPTRESETNPMPTQTIPKETEPLPMPEKPTVPKPTVPTPSGQSDSEPVQIPAQTNSRRY